MEVRAGGERGLKGVGEPVEDGGDMGKEDRIFEGLNPIGNFLIEVVYS